MENLRPIGTRFVTWVRPPLPIIDSIASSESRSTEPTHAKRCVWEIVAHDPSGEIIHLLETTKYRARWIINRTKDTYEWELIPQSEIDSGWYESLRFIDSEINYEDAALLEVR